MNHHITLTFHSRDDFQGLLQVIDAAGFTVARLHPATMIVECYLDDLVLSIVERYLASDIVYHNRLSAVPVTQAFPSVLKHEAVG